MAALVAAEYSTLFSPNKGVGALLWEPLLGAAIFCYLNCCFFLALSAFFYTASVWLLCVLDLVKDLPFPWVSTYLGRFHS